ncbi:MAG: exodeoxyribonuclease III [Deltaproteobacteria bacterium]
MLRVVTWNVNSISVRLERLLALLNRWSPDVVMLQELKCVEDKFPYEAIESAGYHAIVLGQKTYNGVAILSKIPLDRVSTGMGRFYEDEAARVIQGQLGQTTLICCYVPNGQEVGSEKFAYKMKWLEGFKRLIQDSIEKDRSLIVAGDFNIAPEDKDVHDPFVWKDKILCSKEERSYFNQLLELGLCDTFRKHHADSGLFSWWDYRALGFQKNHGLRIDFILASENLAKLCSKSLIDREERKGEKPSDHAPVISEFELSF